MKKKSQLKPGHLCRLRLRLPHLHRHLYHTSYQPTRLPRPDQTTATHSVVTIEATVK